MALRWLCLGEGDASVLCWAERSRDGMGMGEDGDEAMNSMCCVSVYLCPCRVGTQIQCDTRRHY